jgi:hypothetical protein
MDCRENFKTGDATVKRKRFKHAELKLFIINWILDS